MNLTLELQLLIPSVVLIRSKILNLMFILICFALDGKITKSVLKMASGEFDLESIHTLVMRDSGMLIYTCYSITV